MYTNPTVADFKGYFTRDFPYGATPDTVQDADIQRGIDETALVINPALMGTQAFYTTCFLYLAAHMMVLNLRASSQGIAGNYDWLINSKGVGNVSEGISIPQRILDNPELAMLAKTPYGAKYLNLILPYLSGQVFTVHGRTHA